MRTLKADNAILSYLRFLYSSLELIDEIKMRLSSLYQRLTFIQKSLIIFLILNWNIFIAM